MLFFHLAKTEPGIRKLAQMARLMVEKLCVYPRGSRYHIKELMLKDHDSYGCKS